jgi:hypothetical protein
MYIFVHVTGMHERISDIHICTCMHTYKDMSYLFSCQRRGTSAWPRCMRYSSSSCIRVSHVFLVSLFLRSQSNPSEESFLSRSSAKVPAFRLPRCHTTCMRRTSCHVTNTHADHVPRLALNTCGFRGGLCAVREPQSIPAIISTPVHAERSTHPCCKRRIQLPSFGYTQMPEILFEFYNVSVSLMPAYCSNRMVFFAWARGAKKGAVLQFLIKLKGWLRG